MRNIILYLFLALAGACWGRSYSVSEIPNVQVRDHTKHLSNPDGIISPSDQARIDSMLIEARRRTSAEIMAVAVEDIDSDDIDSFATQLFNSWGLGKSDNNNGILILLARDSRQVTIRTGRGADGVLPDILAGRIIRNQMIPQFKNNNYSQGMVDGVSEVVRLVTDPEAAAELMSQERDRFSWDTGDDDAFFQGYLCLSAIVAAFMLAALIIWNFASRKKTPYEMYTQSSRAITICWIVSCLFLFIPVVPTLILYLMRRRWRNQPHKCPQCGSKMCKLDEDTDNQYLTMAQDLEEQLNSVDYDVWLCPQCGETDIYSFVNKNSPYKECPKCHTHAMKLSGTRVLRQPTTQAEGTGEMQYTCLHCHNRSTRRYTIPKKPDYSAGVVAGSVIGSMIGGGGGGGSFGGGFGGGMTGGGGATGRW